MVSLNNDPRNKKLTLYSLINNQEILEATKYYENNPDLIESLTFQDIKDIFLKIKRFPKQTDHYSKDDFDRFYNLYFEFGSRSRDSQNISLFEYIESFDALDSENEITPSRIK